MEHTDAKLARIMTRGMPDQEDFQTVADIFRLLDDPKRLHIFWVLCHVEECVTCLAALLQTSCPNVSHHIRLLKQEGLLTGRREGKEVYYQAADTQEVRLLHRAVEQILQISCPERQSHACREPAREGLTQWEQTVQAVHGYLTSHLQERIPIEELSRKFLVNPTTLKNGFKKMYGMSIAAHMKEHRLETAAQRLTDTGQSVAEIAKSVGYVNQSKFSQAFYEKYGYSPLEYRKRHTDGR